LKNKKKKNEVKQLTEEELEEFYGYDFIAGFTSGEMPYGITREEATEQELLADNEPLDKNSFKMNEDIGDSDLPF